MTPYRNPFTWTGVLLSAASIALIVIVLGWLVDLVGAHAGLAVIS